MSGVVLKEERVKGVFCHNVAHPSYMSMLVRYRRLLLSIYGPKGSSVLISNAAGREAVLCSSSQIIKELCFAHPTTKYINTLISAQNSSCGLHGLYTGLVCVRLLEEALKCEEDMPHPIVSSIAECIISRLMEELDKFPSQVVMELDIGDMDQIVSFVKTIIGAKSNLCLSLANADELSINIVCAFLKSVPNDYTLSGFGHVNIATQEDGQSLPGGVFEGVLYRNPDISKARVEKVGAVSEVKVLLFTIALLYSEETAAISWNGSGTKDENFVSLVLASLIAIIKKRNISIVANQKTIHPTIKFELERIGCLVLERLGTSATEALIRLSDCHCISNLNNLPGALNDAVLGTLTLVKNVVFNNKNYIQLDNRGGCVVTLLLPTTIPSILPTLKETAESCLAALRMAVVDGKVVSGGGCLEAWAAAVVASLITTNVHLLDVHGSATPHHILKVGNIFIQVLMELALHPSGGSSNRFDWSVDTVFLHLWHTPPHSQARDEAEPSTNPFTSLQQRCVCGLVTQDAVKFRYSGWWRPAEFHLPNHLPVVLSRSKKLRNQKMGKHMPKVDMPCGEESWNEPESVSLCTEDSLEVCGSASEEDVDSLEKTPSSLEEEIDSLEGQLESFDIEEYDSLEDILDSYTKPHSNVEDKMPEIKLEHMSGALYDSFSAKFNALRLAFEGFTQLLHIGQCIFDK